MKNRLRQQRHAERAARRRRQRILLGAIAFGVVIIVALFVVLNQGNGPSDQVTATPASTTTSTGLQIVDTLVGAGVEAQVGNTVSVNYTGTLASDGSVFDTSTGRAPYEFTLGTGGVIQGWEQGIPGMKVGGKRTLTIPPELAYGADGYAGVIPPNATLIFEVELLAVKP
jgi:FKBP-type peptidyl-prolyl cis-trans isomerase